MEVFEALTNRQAQIGKEIEKLANAYHSDAPEKKTLTYLQDKHARLQKAWSEFASNEKVIQESQTTQPSHQYFTSNYYKEVQLVYDAILAEILSLINSVQAHQAAGSHKVHAVQTHQTAGSRKAPESCPEIAKIIRNQERLLTTLDQLLTTALSNSGVQSPQYYAVKAETAKKYWNEIEEANKRIWENVEDKNSYDMKQYFAIQEKYQSVLIKFADEQHQGNRQSAMNFAPDSSPMMRLPKIELPKFDGSYLKWQQFFDLFNQMVHSQPMSGVQKMFYLKANLEGEAERLIRHISVSEVNYSSAWDVLVNRYANKRLLVNALLEKLLSQPIVSCETASAIKTLHDITSECVLGLENLGLCIYDHWDPILLHVLLKKLDKSTHAYYEQSLTKPRELQSLKKFLDFLELRFQALEALGPRKSFERVKPKSAAVHSAVNKSIIACYYCNKPHLIYSCDRFIKLSPQEREAAVKRLNLCLNCLKQDHTVHNCKSSGCRKCNGKHHTRLHAATVEGRKKDTPNPPLSSNLGLNPSKEGSYVLLGTASVFVLNGQGQPVKCRVLLDSGSQVSLVSERLSRKLKLPNTRDQLDISGIGNSKLSTSDRVHITLTSRGTKFSTSVEAHVIKDITCQQPQQFVNIEGWKIPPNVSLADPDFNKPDKIDLLIGAELYGEIMLSDQVNLGAGLPVLQNTTLGWIVLGKVATSNPFCGITNAELNNNLKQFWEMEECPGEKLFSQTDRRAEEFFQSTTIRNTDGRYIVNLPILTEPSLLGQSQNMAQRRLISLEKKLQKQPDIYRQYKEFLEDYLRSGHMQEIDYEDIPETHYFVPHHYVLKPSSTTTKLRVVFDASAKTSSNLSLNDLMVAGPRIQDDLFDIILRFRGHKYVFTADIAKMYRQVLLNEEDRHLQLILWRNNPSESMRVFKLLTVTYGTKAAQFLATRCLRQLAEDEGIRYPRGAGTIQDFYVDDVITGHDSLFGIRRIREELDKMMTAGGFKLRKWCANHSAILEGIPREELEMQIDFARANEDYIKTLGLSWEPRRDCFKYTITWPDRTTISKRTILSDIAQLYDPLGLVNPVVVLGKIFMQQLWSMELDWDDQLPDDLQTKWLDFKANLRFLDNLKIGRYAIVSPSAQAIELHAFADASERAFGTAIYIRSIDQKGNILVKLLCAKSRVAPRKFVTLPRLELCAAKLATQLAQKVLTTMSIKFSSVTYWSDSTIVLSWIHGDPATLKTFNANRVQRIQEVSSSSQWKYINTKLNPADLVSRGTTPQLLRESELWFCGPAFLKAPEAEWPKSSFEIAKIPSEEKVFKVVLNSSVTNTPLDLVYRIDHGNSFLKLQRVIAYVLRAVKIMRGKISKETWSDFLEVKELDEALTIIVKAIQASSFRSEIEDFKREKTVKASSRLATLTPFLDGNGLLRVGGRLEAAEIAYGAKHPLLLPGDHELPKLLLSHLHVKHFHAGPQALLAIARQRFWILQARTLVRSVVNNCVKCARAKPRLLQQLMGNLPSTRVLPGRPFVTAGVDFCGPIWTHYKLRGKRPRKSYVAVFCCFATKAVHLEVVSDLTTEAFIGALKRFTARRGICRNIYCDNATNFVGASNKLSEIYSILQDKEAKEKIAVECTSRGIQFHFNPPRAPHFGGLWEAAVKSFKQLLYKTVAPASLTFEELTTVVAEIEAILNSRPLTPMSCDPNDLSALTPGHFLIGEPLTAVPDAEQPAKMSSLSRWKLVSSVTQEFWKRWTVEYLAELQRKVKWTTESPNINVGTMVILKDDNLPPLRWPLGRVEDVHVGKDGKVRVAVVRTATGTLTRAIHNLCPLPIESRNEDDKVSSGSSKRGFQEEREDGSKRRRRPVAGAIGTFLLTCLLLPCLSFAAHVDQYVQVIPFANQAGIYYENLGHARITSHEWKWVVYYNMSSYWNMLTTIEKGVKKLEIMEAMLHKQSYLEAIIKQHQHNLREIHDINELLLSHHGLRPSARSRRGLINGVGMVARKLFGILDEDYAAEVRDTISQVNQNEDHLLQLLRNQTSIIEATTSLIKRSEEERIKQARAVQNVFEDHIQRFSNIAAELKEEKITQTFLALSAFVSLIGSEYQGIQATLLETITDVHHGKMNPRIMSGSKLRAEITAIKEHLPSSLGIPSKEIAGLYRLMTVKCDINQEYTIFVVKLPLASTMDFELFRLIPLPTLINGSYVSVNPSTELLMVNLGRDAFYQLSMMDFTHCTELDPENVLCPQVHPIYDRNADIIRCEAEMMNFQRISNKCSLSFQAPSRIWRQLSHANQWVFSLDRTYIYNIICGRETIQKTLRASGLLRLQKGCVLKDDHVTLTAHSHFDSTFNTSFHPTINLPNEISFPGNLSFSSQARIDVLYGNHTEELARLQRGIQNVRGMTFLPTHLQPHDVHQFSIGYAALGIAALIGICVCCLYFRLRSMTWTPTASSAARTRPPKDSIFTIELDKFKAGEDV